MSKERIELLKQLRDSTLKEQKRLAVELKTIDDLLSHYEGSIADTEKPLSRPSMAIVAPIHLPPALPSSPGIMHTAIKLALELYDSSPRFVTTGEVLSELEKRGHKVGGKSQSGNVSSYLNHSPELTNFKGYGWVRTRDKVKWEKVIGSMISIA